MSCNHSGILTASWSSSEKIISSIALFVVNVLAIAGNFLVVLVIVRTRELRRKESNWFVVNLALADLFVAFTVIPTTLDTIISGGFPLGFRFKEFIGFANFLFCICSIMNLQLLSFDRWFAIAKPFRYISLVSPRKVVAASLLVWLYAMLCALPPKFGVSSYFCFIPNLDNCELEKDWAGSSGALVFAIAVLGLTYCFALSVMAVCYWKIFRIARSHVRRINVQNFHSCTSSEKRRQLEMKDNSFSSTGRLETSRKTLEILAPIPLNTRQTKGHRPHASDIRTAKSFLIVIGAYFFCWTPFCVKLFLETLKKEKINPKVSLIFLWLGYTNSCLNPLIYTWKYKQFRNALISSVKKLRGRLSLNRSS
ncbi:octopamine receptor Oamb-like [Stylophora pistillata]|uniref:octopamine receptor Oamb-like n=1 Tax=Stylophora pistillata TaxID=50429 RepID=UPI000C04F976|nr:octopamine receptor Oamb-like [Stylophora pistillata]